MHKTFALIFCFLILCGRAVVLGQTAMPDATSANATPKFEYFAGASFSGVFSGAGPVSLFGPNLGSAFSTRDSQQGGFGAPAIPNLGPHLRLKAQFSQFARTQPAP